MSTDVVVGFENLSGLARNDLLLKLEELENMWKINPSIEGFGDIIQSFGINSSEDLIPQRVYDHHKLHWNTYIRIRTNIEMKTDDDGMEVAADTITRFNKFQQNLCHSYMCLSNFMRASNCNGAFPTPTTSEVLFWYQPLNTDGMTAIHTLILYLLGRLTSMRLRRSHGCVYEQVVIGNKATHAWTEKMTIKDMIREFCDKETHNDMWKHSTTGGNYEAAIKYLTTSIDPEFPELKIKRRAWSFNEGIYDATDDSFTLYEDPIDEHLVTCKIITRDFLPAYYSGQPRISPKLTYDQLKTPKFDSIFEPQEWDESMLWWMFVFIGRLFYEVNEKDSWQVIPFMKGVAGTGKSTVIKVVQMMYAMKEIGVISNSIETKFGLSTVYGKTVFVIPELKGDFALDQAQFQSMVTGEEVSMPVKFGEPIVDTWTMPGIMAGNEAAGWEDKSGSISRRIVVFDFPNKISEERSNPNLINEIKEAEIPTIIRKSALAYHSAVEKYRKGDIWSVLPPRICQEKKRLQYSTNPLYAFINSDNIKLDPEEYTMESTFIAKLKSFAALKFPNSVITFTPDFYSYIFSDFDLSIKTETMPWPTSSTTNIQTQSYLFGCRVCETG